MCLAIPGQVVALGAPDPLAPMGQVDFGGVVKDVCFAYLPDVQLGEYVLVHVGFAISRIDEQAAHETLATLASLEAYEEDAFDELEPSDPPGRPPRPEGPR
jgi:hydrogenase expression/formation protein HypC